MREATRTTAHFQTAHAVMERHDAGGVVKTLATTLAISVLCDLLLDLKHPTLQVDGQYMHDLFSEEKINKQLVPPSDYFADSCYDRIFDLFLGKRAAYMTVDGDLGRRQICRYIREHEGRASPISQETLDGLGINLDLETNLLATGGGSIFQVFINSGMTLVILRPSVGSYAFNEYVTGGEHDLLCLMAALHSQIVFLGACMGKTIPVFRSNTSPLSVIFNKEGASDITSLLRSKGLIGDDVVYRTPQENGGHASVAGAGEYSANLGRDAMTMQERGELGGEASAAGAGLYSQLLDRITLTMSERGHLGGLAVSGGLQGRASQVGLGSTAALLPTSSGGPHGHLAVTLPSPAAPSRTGLPPQLQWAAPVRPPQQPSQPAQLHWPVQPMSGVRPADAMEAPDAGGVLFRVLPRAGAATTVNASWWEADSLIRMSLALASMSTTTAPALFEHGSVPGESWWRRRTGGYSANPSQDYPPVRLEEIRGAIAQSTTQRPFAVPETDGRLQLAAALASPAAAGVKRPRQN